MKSYNINSNSINSILIDIYDFAKKTYNDWTNFSCILKMNEELGELSEGILIEIGQIKHKTLPKIKKECTLIHLWG